MKAISSIIGTPKVEYSVIINWGQLIASTDIVCGLEVFQFKLRGNFRKTDAVSVLDLDLINVGGENAA